MKNTLKRIVLDTDTNAGRNFDLFIQFCIVLSLISFAVETVEGLSANAKLILDWIEVGTVSIFSVEYLLRIWLSDKKLAYIFSFFGIIDLVAILPFYLSTGIDLRSIRVLRLMRLFRILKLAHYSDAITTFQKAFSHVKAELAVFGVFSLLILYVASVGIYIFEHEAQPEAFGSIFDSLWWSIVTLTTVGYGDSFPITVGGKIFTSFVVIIGLGIIAVPTGLFASALSKTIKNK
ncbi:MAG: ion transporter [Candidatus Neomarinimicrobiota bacterium]